MGIKEEKQKFDAEHPLKTLDIGSIEWKYTTAGKKGTTPILWLTGGMRYADAGFRIFSILEKDFYIIAPNYPCVYRMQELVDGIAEIVKKEGYTEVNVVGQSYGGIVAQVLLLQHTDLVQNLILSSTAPLYSSPSQVLFSGILTAIVKKLPEKLSKTLFLKYVSPALSSDEAEKAFWQEYLKDLIMNKWSKNDIVSLFETNTDAIKNYKVEASFIERWDGKTVYLYSENDPTQEKRHFQILKKIYKDAYIHNFGNLGHTAALMAPDEYCQILKDYIK